MKNWKINVAYIVRMHLRTLVSARSGKPSFSDYFSFLAIPLILGAGFSWKEWFLNDKIINLVCTSMSIFIGLFFNVVMLLFQINQSLEKTESDDPNEGQNGQDPNVRLRVEARKQLLYNILFSIFLGVVAATPRQESRL